MLSQLSRSIWSFRPRPRRNEDIYICNFVANKSAGVLYAHVTSPKRVFIAHVCAAYLSCTASATVRLVCDAWRVPHFINAVRSLFHETYVPYLGATLFGDEGEVVAHLKHTEYRLRHSDSLRRLVLCSDPTVMVTGAVDFTLIDTMRFADTVKMAQAASSTPVFAIVMPQEAVAHMGRTITYEF